MKRTALAVMLLLAACAGPLAGDEPAEGPGEQAGATDGQAATGDQQRPPPAPDGSGLLSLPGMTLDLDNRRITLQAQVCLREGLLELLVCRRNSGRTHESILQTSAVPSDVHAALLALGLSPGVPARWISLPDGEWQAIPPRGGLLAITLRWADVTGEVHQRPADEWLKLVGETPPNGRKWVFVGSELLPDGAYWADATGEVITVSNFPSTLIDVPFESTTTNTELLYHANTDAIPPLGTMVEVVITPLAGAETADYARTSIAIDRNGDIHADDRIIAIDEVSKWAMDFMRVHKKGEVVIRTDPLVLSDRVRQVRLELRIGGVYQVHELRMDLRGQLLPRTSRQMQVELDQLDYDLTHPDELLTDPYEQAELLLEQIARERQELQRLDELWRQYADSVRQAVAQRPPADSSTGPLDSGSTREQP